MKWKDHVQNFGHVGSHLAITARVARLLLLSFVVTFLTARIIVYLIVEQHLPNLFLFVKGTHVHHLTYGIYLMSLVGTLLLLCRPRHAGLYLGTIGYGVALALTFDEFGMWLFLGGTYNSQLTFDAVVIIVSLLTLIALAAIVEERHPRHWVIAAVVTALVALLAVLSYVAHKHDLMGKVFSISGL